MDKNHYIISFLEIALIVSSKLTLIIKLKTLNNKLNYDYLDDFLINGFVKAPNTIIKIFIS